MQVRVVFEEPVGAALRRAAVFAVLLGKERRLAIRADGNDTGCVCEPGGKRTYFWWEGALAAVDDALCGPGIGGGRGLCVCHVCGVPMAACNSSLVDVCGGGRDVVGCNVGQSSEDSPRDFTASAYVVPHNHMSAEQIPQTCKV